MQSTAMVRLPVDVLEALRDAEKDLDNWRRSPLRPLIEQLMAELDEDARDSMETQINAAQDALSSRDDVSATGAKISQRLCRLPRDRQLHPDRSRVL
jgi:putative ATP-dependent endonuclease of OLD family